MRRRIVALGIAVALGLPGTALAAGNGQIAAWTDGDVFTVNASAGPGFRYHVISTPAFQPSWSPDGNRIAMAASGGIAVLDLASGGTRVLTASPPSESDLFPSWTPDGARIVFLRGASVVDSSTPDQVMSIAADGGGEPALLGTLPHDTTDIDWASGGRYARTKNGVRELAVGTLNGEERVLGRAADGVSWSPDGSRIVYSSFDALWITSPDAWPGTPVTSPVAHTTVSEPEFSPDGNRIAYVAQYVHSSTLQVTTIADGSTVDVAVQPQGNIWEPDWQPCIAGVTVSCVSPPLFTCPAPAPMTVVAGRPTLTPPLCPSADRLDVSGGWSNGLVTLAAGGRLTIRPGAKRRGPDQVAFRAWKGLDSVPGWLTIRVVSHPTLTPSATPRLARRVLLRARCDIACTVRLRVSVRLAHGHVAHGRTVTAKGTSFRLRLPAPKARRVASARIVGTVSGAGSRRPFTLKLKR